jgi:hypothetical protein
MPHVSLPHPLLNPPIPGGARTNRRGRRAGDGSRQVGNGGTSGWQPESGRAGDGQRRLARGRATAAGRDRSRATGIGPERRESVHSDGDRSMVTGIGRLLMGKHWRQLQGRREQRGSGRKIRRKLILD